MITIITAIPNKENVKEIANEAFYQNVEFWVGVSFILVVICLFPSAVKLIKQLINQRIERIKNDLQTAETLKLDAQKLYAKYERKFINTDNEVAEIIENQKEIIEQNKESKLKELNKMLKQKENDAIAKVNQAREDAKIEINKTICHKALNFVIKAAKLKLTKSDYEKLINASIANIEKLEFNKNSK